MKLNISYLFILFFVYSCLGWILEVTCKLIETKKFINRGFLIGPYCPIYGAGAILITTLLYKYSYDPVILFFMTIIICGALEYLTSYIMEKLFKARWWDYSKRKFNLDGRICLGTIIPFGLFGMILTYITNPIIIEILSKIHLKILNIISIEFGIIFLADIIVSTFVILGFRKTTLEVGKNIKQDNTEQITEKVRQILLQKSWSYKRLVEAFPNFEAIKTKIHKITYEVKENINVKAEDLKNKINTKKEEVKNTINEKTQEMKETFVEKKKAFSNEFIYRKRKIKINFNLGKRKLKRTFKGKNI